MIARDDLERDVVQFAAREVATVAMETPLREPILEAVERTTDAPVVESADADAEAGTAEESGADGPSIARGLVAVALAIGAIYVLFRLLGEDGA
ncbi:hypothetical protein [Halovivax sp.]|uniref:hypothetical protein n=1 Tax=Halovivax sp. TaxID=1935978 RepID=UPI0025C444EC|nr:hypothetical protein [Halovivax sp.]